MPSLMLIAAPWALFNRPSIQVASLKAYVQQRFPDLEARAAHLHLETAAHLGYPLYQQISERSWLAEAVAAFLLFPEQGEEIKELFRREARGGKALRGIDLAPLARQLDTLFSRFLDSVAWNDYGLVGFSVSLCQTTSSLLLIHRLKQRCRQLPVVVGGSTFAGERPETLAKLIPAIDHLVRGEGEQPLAELVDQYCRQQLREGWRASPATQAIPDLDTLPLPDFSEYFQFLQTLPGQQRFLPTLPLEMSRGCRWQARHRNSVPSPQSGDGACAFCNLNLQWQGYRHKSAERVAEEITQQSTRHRLLSLAFMDNLLPSREGERLMHGLAEQGKDLRLFVEVRADLGPRRLQAMYRGGVRQLQVGVESLSSRLLAKIGKGTTALQNIEMLRHCEALGLPHGGNLLLAFPGSDEEDVAQTLANLARVTMFRPLQAVQFWLGLDSPVCKNPDFYGISVTGNHGNWRTLLGKRLGSQLRLLIQGDRGGRAHQKRLWSPVAKALKAWQASYAALAKGSSDRCRPPILGYQDGGEFLIITQRRQGGDTLQHRLPSASRRLYLACRASRSRRQLQRDFPDLAADRLDAFLHSMLDKGLMFAEANRYLSLAIPHQPGVERLSDLPPEGSGEVDERR